MARKLKTYITNLGFFELAIAAPSMKAALEAWGMTHNAFQRGFARQTDDPEIIAAAAAKPGVVLRRPVGSHGPFKENADLPDSLPAIRPPKSPNPPARSKRSPKADRGSKPAGNLRQEKAAILSFQKAKKRRDRQQAKEQRRLDKQQARRRRAMDKAEATFERARKTHEQAVAAIEQAREALEKRAETEAARWQTQRGKLQAAIERAASL